MKERGKYLFKLDDIRQAELDAAALSQDFIKFFEPRAFLMRSVFAEKSS